MPTNLRAHSATSRQSSRVLRWTLKLAHTYPTREAFLDSGFLNTIGEQTVSTVFRAAVVPAQRGRSVARPLFLDPISVSFYFNLLHFSREVATHEILDAVGATFNRSAWRAMGSVIGRELRSLWLQGKGENHPPTQLPHLGLDCWSPNVGIVRDPRWGRNMECAGEVSCSFYHALLKLQGGGK